MTKKKKKKDHAAAQSCWHQHNHRVSRQAPASSPQAGACDRRPELQASLKANHYFFIQLTRVHLSGSEGKVSGETTSAEEKSLFMAVERFDSGTKATSSPSTFKEAGIRGARNPKWKLGQLETPPANTACTLHRNKAPHYDIQGNCTRSHFCSLYGQYWSRIFFFFCQ